MRITDRSENFNHIEFEETLDSKKYREAYADLMRTSKSTRESGLTYFSFLSRMKQRNLDRKKREYFQRRLTISEKTAPITCETMKGI